MAKKKNLILEKLPPEIRDLWDDTEFLTYSSAIVGVIFLIGGGFIL